MTKDACRTWLERKGYKVLYVMGSYPFPGHYVADGRSWGGYHTAKTLNGLYNSVKCRYKKS